jgi:hypothetical protein
VMAGRNKINSAQRATMIKRYHDGEDSRALGLEYGVDPAYVRSVSGGRMTRRLIANTPPVPSPPSRSQPAPPDAALSREALRLHAKGVPRTAIAAITRIPHAELARLLPSPSPVPARPQAEGVGGKNP